ncbi:hypothetical protein F5Y14DRAFT_397367 [Nemania sp. NC0429]|nr:hypothetical protein F5Y14DRAFT_397367 [Nemania sp. NC0429]
MRIIECKYHDTNERAMDFQTEQLLEKTYAGVLGKLIGVYLGRPFETWTHQRIIKELGHIRYYVNQDLGVPLVVTDDDVSGTFTFIRALEEHGPERGRLVQAIGDTCVRSIWAQSE